jgi:hypothetical protein
LPKALWKSGGRPRKSLDVGVLLLLSGGFWSVLSHELCNVVPELLNGAAPENLLLGTQQEHRWDGDARVRPFAGVTVPESVRVGPADDDPDKVVRGLDHFRGGEAGREWTTLEAG